MKDRIILDPTKIELDKKNFVSYFDQYDARKDLSLVDVFPELTEFYQQCKLFRLFLS
jgi:hypothetical protein